MFSKSWWDTLNKKDPLYHPSLPYAIALQAQASISSTERHGICHAHLITTTTTPIGKLLHLSFPKS
jgi:hypothetical protein